jgi:hypothetical protein
MTAIWPRRSSTPAESYNSIADHKTAVSCFDTANKWAEKTERYDDAGLRPIRNRLPSRVFGGTVRSARDARRKFA